MKEWPLQLPHETLKRNKKPKQWEAGCKLHYWFFLKYLPQEDTQQHSRNTLYSVSEHGTVLLAPCFSLHVKTLHKSTSTHRKFIIILKHAAFTPDVAVKASEELNRYYWDVYIGNYCIARGEISSQKGDMWLTLLATFEKKKQRIPLVFLKDMIFAHFAHY